MAALPEPAPQRYELDLASMVHLLNIYAFEFKAAGCEIAHVMPYRNGAGWMLVNRWSNGAEFIEDYDTDAELVTALDARLRATQRTAAGLRGGM